MKIRKLTALALCAVLLLGLMTGCQKPMDAETLVQKMNEAIGDKSPSSMTIAMELEMTMKVQGTSMDMSIALDSALVQSDTASYVDMDMTLGMLGIKQEMNMETYTTLEDGKYVNYLYSELDDTWLRSEVDADGLSDQAPVTAYASLAELPPEELTLDEEKQTLNDREVYVLRATLSGAQMQDTFTSALGTSAEDLDEMTATVMKEMDFTPVSAPTVFYIDAETFLPVKMEMDIQGMGEVMSSMMGAVMSSLVAGLGTEDTEITVDVTTCTFLSDAISFESVEVPAVPQEGIDAAAANPLQSDGSYILRDGDNAVRIVLPEGYTVLDADEYYVTFVNDDYTVYGEYSLLYTDEEEILAYIDSEEQYATEAEYFVSRSEIAEVGEYKTIQILYTEDMADYYAWRQMDGCMLDVMVSVMDSSAAPTLDELLECVEDYEG